MEVVGVVAAVPELVKLIHHVAITAGQISSGTRMAKVAQGSQAQLQVLEQILRSIQQREEIRCSSGVLKANLFSVLRDVEAEVEGLQRLLVKVAGSSGTSRLMKRAHLVLGGFEKQFTGHLRRIEGTISLLQLHLTESAFQFSQRAQLRKMLHPSIAYFIPERLVGTCEWLWSHERFKFWMGCRVEETLGSFSKAKTAEPVSDRILSIYGVKGSGKSVLAFSAAEELRNRGYTTLFYSFWAGNDEATRSITMFRDLLWQSVNTLPEEKQMLHISRLLESPSELTKRDVLQTELRKVCEAHCRPLCIVLDGIDESVDDWNNLKSGPLATLTELLQSDSWLRLLLVGRQSSLRSTLRNWPLSIEITSKLIDKDLNRFIASEIDECPTINDPIVREQVQRDLESRSGVMFLWVKLVFKQLRQSFCLSEITSTLGRSPNELNKEYSQLFTMLIRRLGGHPKTPSVGMDRAKRLLELIIGASRPLTMIELRLAYAYSFYSTGTESPDMGSHYISQEAVLDACGDFVTVQGDLVYFGHASIREFLLRPSEQWEYDNDGYVRFFSLDSTVCERALGLACLQYLRRVKWRRDGNSQSLDDLTREYPFLGYASTYMMSHILSSDPKFEQSSEILRPFLSSTDVFDYMNHVLNVDDDEANNTRPLPLQFWDDFLHFLIAWDLSGLSQKPLSGTDPKRIILQPRVLDYGDARATCIQLMGQGFPSVPVAQSYLERWYDFTLQYPPLELDAIKHMVQNHNKFGIPQLQLAILNVGACLKQAKILANPVDIVLQALEKSFRGMSFFALMACGRMAEKSKPAQALRIYGMALEKVQNRGGIKEAWVSCRMGDCLRCHDGIEDLKRAERYYCQAIDILAKAPQNPLTTFGWCSAARCRVDCLDYEESDQVKALTKEIESRLLSSLNPVKDPGILRNWSYSMIWDSGVMMRQRMEEVFLLGQIYRYHDLTEDVERLMTSVTLRKSYTNSLDHDSRFKSMDWLAFAMNDLGKYEEARKTWRQARTLLDRNNAHDQKLMESTTFNIVETFLNELNFVEAEKELSSLTNLSKLLEDISLDEDRFNDTIKNIINTYMIVVKKEKAIQVMQACITAVQPLVKHYEDIWYRHLQTIASMFLSWQSYDFCEEVIRQMLREACCDDERVYLYEALAFSLCYQTSSKRHDPYNYYLSATAFYSGNSHYSLNENHWPARLKLGLTRACESTGRCQEAAMLLQSVVDDCESTECSPMCIRRRYGHFFQGRVHLLRGKAVDAIMEFSQVTSEYSIWQRCICWTTDYESSVLIISSHLYLVELFTNCGCQELAKENQAQALSVLKGRFFEPFESQGQSRVQELSPLISAWSAGALSDILACSSEEGDKWKRFPFEIGWPLWDGRYDIDILHAMSDG